MDKYHIVIRSITLFLAGSTFVSVAGVAWASRAKLRDLYILGMVAFGLAVSASTAASQVHHISQPAAPYTYGFLVAFAAGTFAMVRRWRSESWQRGHKNG